MIADLKFERVGCCGEYLNASVALDDGSNAIVTDNEDGTYTVAVFKDGMLVGGLHRAIDAAGVESLLF